MIFVLLSSHETWLSISSLYHAIFTLWVYQIVGGCEILLEYMAGKGNSMLKKIINLQGDQELFLFYWEDIYVIMYSLGLKPNTSPSIWLLWKKKCHLIWARSYLPWWPKTHVHYLQNLKYIIPPNSSNVQPIGNTNLRWTKCAMKMHKNYLLILTSCEHQQYFFTIKGERI